jgi:ABC-type nitrate/sulfonate/bicarbonate transport system permease component
VSALDVAKATGGRLSAWRSPARVPLVRRPGGRMVLGALGSLTALALWELAVAVGILPAADVPSATDVLAEFVRLLGTSAFWDAVWRTLWGAAVGLGLAVAVGVPIGMLMGSSLLVHHALRPTVEFLRPVPGVALIPLIVLIWGQNVRTVWTLVAFACVWPMLIQSLYGAQGIDEVARDTARSFRLTRVERIRFLIVPGTLPYIATGIRISASMALIVAVSVELLTGAPGLGSAIVRAQDATRFTEMYALIVASGVLGIAINLVFGRAERHFLRWHQSQRPGGEA